MDKLASVKELRNSLYIKFDTISEFMPFFVLGNKYNGTTGYVPPKKKKKSEVIFSLFKQLPLFSN